MEEVKKKGFFRRFFDWLNNPDEDEVVDGEINIKAFKDEDRDTLMELKVQAKKIDQKGFSTFMDKTKKRAEKVKEIKAKVETPTRTQKNVYKKGKEYEIEK